MKSLWLSLCTCACLYAVPNEINATKEDEAMRLLYMKNGCSSCHGIYAEGIGVTPRLQGQKEEVLIRRLKNLKKGKPRTPFGTIMVSFAKALSDDEIVKMAKYLSKLKRVEPEEKYELEYEDNTGDGSS